MDQIVVFPIIITPVANERKYPYLVEIPALDGLTQGRDIADAIEMARDYIGTFSLTDELPPSDPTLPPVKADSLTTLVTVNISAYRRRYDKKVVKKTITIPNYLNELGKEHQINFSELMTQALKEKFNV
ncbi:type II toxin-antitoxin system HicB family antitoxin [Ligilactobacillus animalis]|nr:type II toxin-antitoxin system HicB family antitoxin [Ligilactobacillus animalis]